MSSPPIKSPKSPPRQWLSNDDQSAAPRRSSEIVASKQAVLPEPVTVSTSSADKIEDSNAPPMSYPIDENLFYSAPSQPLASTLSAEVQSHEVEQATYDGSTAEEIQPPPDFKQLFTLIEDPETGEHYHPTVHYIFSDDDPEILTSAAHDALDSHGETRRSNAPQEKVDERYVIVDLAADGKTVTSAASLSKDWQAVQASIAQAPSVDNSIPSEDRGLMLKISGKESRRLDYEKQRRSSLQGADSVENMVAMFSGSLNKLDEVLGGLEDLRDESKHAE